MVVAVLLGIVIGLALGSLGGGGSILAVPVLVYVAGQSVVAATSTSLVAVGVASLVAAIGHSRSGHIRWGAAAAFIVTGIAGSWAGTVLNGRINGDVLLLAFSGLVVVAAHRMLTACPSCTRVGEEAAVAFEGAGLSQQASAGFSGASVGRVLLAGSIVGFLTGLFGVGGGFIIVPALTLVLGLSMRAAIGTSLVVIVGNAAVSLGFRGLDAVDWKIAVPFTVAMLIGAGAGSVVAHRLPQKRSLQAFAVILIAVALANAVASTLALATS